MSASQTRRLAFRTRLGAPSHRAPARVRQAVIALVVALTFCDVTLTGFGPAAEAAPPLPIAAPLPDSTLWRNPQNDGLNCLYLQLRLLGYRGTYADLLLFEKPM